MLTVDSLAAGLGLELDYAAGAGGGSRPLSWAHVVDLPDPWNWIGPGELILTTGTGIPAERDQAEWIERVIGSGAGALLIAPKPGSEPLGGAALSRADDARFPVLSASFDARFTLIAREVINATLERESRRLASAQRVFTLYAASLAREEHWSSRLRGIARRLELRAELWTAAPDARLLFFTAEGIGGEPDEASLARAAPLRPWPADAAPLLLAVSPTNSEAGQGPGSGSDRPQDRSAEPASRPDPDPGRPEGHEPDAPGRVTEPTDATRHSFATVFAIELMLRRREAGVAADSRGVLAELWADGAADRGCLEDAFPQLHTGDDPWAHPRFFVVPCAPRSAEVAEALRAPDLWDAPFAAFARGGDLALLLAGSEDERATVLESVARVVPGLGIGPEITAETSAAESLRLATLAAGRSNQEQPVVEGSGLRAADLVIPAAREQRAAIAEALLGPLAAHDRERGTELLATLECYYAEERSQARAANLLGVHRHTLDHRLRTIESILGMHPAATAAIAQLWIALEARRLGDWAPGGPGPGPEAGAGARPEAGAGAGAEAGPGTAARAR